MLNISKYEFFPFDARRFADFVKIEVKERGNELVFKQCPYCKDKSTDKYKFAINLNTGQYHCFREKCGAKGNMLTLARDFNFDIDTYSENRRQSIRTYRDIDTGIKPQSKQPAIDYMKSRGISEEVTKKYNITIQNENPDALVFPFYDENDKLQFIKYRLMHFDKSIHSYKEWAERGCKPILFGMNHCNKSCTTLVLTEGQIDSLSLAEAGIPNPVSVGTGARGFTWISNCWDFLQNYKCIIVFGDNEDGHITLIDEIVKRFPGQVKQVREEDYKGCKDANEILQKYGKDALKEAVDRAVPVSHPNILALADVERKNINHLEHITTGIPYLDWVIGGFYFGQLIVLTGERGDGKSTLASQFATIALENDVNVFVYSGELMNWYLKSWVESQIAGREHINTIKDDNGRESYSVDAGCLTAIESWYRDKIYIYDRNITKPENEEATLLDTIEVAIRQYDCRFLIIDNLMTALIDDLSSDQYRQQTKFVNGLVNMAKKYNVLILLVAHPRKHQGTLFDNDDVAGSANITNLADVVMKYSRPKDDELRENGLRVLSVYKNRLTGKLCTKGIKMYYDSASKRISDTNGKFDWKLGWEKLLDDNTEDMNYESELPFM